jgi:hypothetical protein
MRPKWEREDYREATINAALGYVSSKVGGSTASSSTVITHSTTCCTPTSPSGELLFRSTEADLSIALHWGLPNPTMPGAQELCRLPGHKGHWAGVYVGRGGDVLYECRASEGAAPVLTLPQVRASVAYGCVTRLKDENGNGQASEHVTWRLRALWEVGAIEPLEILHVDLPKNAPMAARRVYERLLLLLGLKKHVWPDAMGTTCSWRFGAAWFEVNERTAQKGMAWLLAHGYVVKGEKVKSRYGKEMAVLIVRDYVVDWRGAAVYFAEMESFERERPDELYDAIEEEMGPCDPEILADMERLASEEVLHA